MIEIKSNWIAVSDRIPDENVVVETKIQDEHMGCWCLLRRTIDSNKCWKVIDSNPKYTEFNQIKFNPTHWHY